MLPDNYRAKSGSKGCGRPGQAQHLNWPVLELIQGVFAWISGKGTQPEARAKLSNCFFARLNLKHAARVSDLPCLTNDK